MSSEEKKTPKANALESANFIYSLISLARRWKVSDELSRNLASSLIYANLGEFLSAEVLSTIKVKINLGLYKFKYGIRGWRDDELTNLEHMILRLKQFEFPHREEFIESLTNLKVSRNKLFHNILVSKERGIDNPKLIKSIQDEGEKLLKLWSAIFKSTGD